MLNRSYWALVGVLFCALLTLPAATNAWGQDAPTATTQEVATDDAPPQRASFLRYCWDASPTFFVGMFLLSMVMLYFGIHNMIRLQLEKLVPPSLVASLDGMLAEKKYKEAYEMVKSDGSPLGKSLAAGIERLSQGFDRAMDAMLGTADDHRMEIEHSISNINMIAAVAPMLGLLGTVLGMILAFQKIGLGTQIQPALLAQDIGLALVSTLEGLVIAIPAIAIFAFLRNRLTRLMYEVESTGETYLLRFASALKKST